jgi:hypothetical protein
LKHEKNQTTFASLPADPSQAEHLGSAFAVEFPHCAIGYFGGVRRPGTGE